MNQTISNNSKTKNETEQKNTTKVPVKEQPPAEKGVEEMMADGKSLGEIQNELQSRKPYYKEQKK